MNLVLPDVSSTVGPTWATLLNAAYTLIDSHDHSSGNGTRITPAGLNISSDLSFSSNNATNLRSLRLYNNLSFSTGVNDKTCLYTLNGEIHYIDAVGNDIQITSAGALNVSVTLSTITIKDSSFTLQYFGDTSKQSRLDNSALTASTTNVYTLPNIGASATNTDTLVTNTSTSTLTNKSLKTTTTAIVDATDTTKAIRFTSSGNTTAKTLTIASAVTNDRTITVPDVTDTLAVLGSSQTFSAAQNVNASLTMRGANTIVFNNSGNTFYTSLAAGANVANYAAKLPIADGTSGQLLKTDGSGQWGWASAASYSRGDTATTATIAALSSTNSFQRLTGSTATTLQGITAGTAGLPLILYNVSTALVSIAHQNGSASAANRIITPSGQTVDLQPQWTAYFVYDDSQSRWILTATTCAQEWTAYTPTISAGFGTSTSISFYYKIVGDSLHVKGTFTGGNVAGSIASITLPTGFTISTSKIPNSSATTGSANSPHVGQYVCANANNTGPLLVCGGTSTSLVYYGGGYSGSVELTAQNGTGITGNSIAQSVNFEVPIV